MKNKITRVYPDDIESVCALNELLNKGWTVVNIIILNNSEYQIADYLLQINE